MTSFTADLIAACFYAALGAGLALMLHPRTRERLSQLFGTCHRLLRILASPLAVLSLMAAVCVMVPVYVSHHLYFAPLP